MANNNIFYVKDRQDKLQICTFLENKENVSWI